LLTDDRLCCLGRFSDGGVRLIDTDCVFRVRTTESFTVNNPSHHHYHSTSNCSHHQDILSFWKAIFIWHQNHLSFLHMRDSRRSLITCAFPSLIIIRTSSRDSTILLTQLGDSHTQKCTRNSHIHSNSLEHSKDTLCHELSLLSRL